MCTEYVYVHVVEPQLVDSEAAKLIQPPALLRISEKKTAPASIPPRIAAYATHLDMNSNFLLRRITTATAPARPSLSLSPWINQRLPVARNVRSSIDPDTEPPKEHPD